MSTESVVYEMSLRDLLSGKINEANSNVNKFEGSLNSATGAAKGLAGALGLAFGVAGIVAFARSMVDAGSKVENARTGLTTLLKDANDANSVIKNTMQDAMTTPFAFEGLLSANKALISAGVNSKNAREDVLNLANAIAATGGGDNELQRMVVNLQQIRNTGKATALDIKQFAYAGVNVYKVLADATGQPIEKVKDMEVSYDMLTMALKKAHDTGGIYARGLENMAGNTSVQISNLGDSMFQLSVKMFDDLKPAITTIISGLASFIGTLRTGWDWLVKNKQIIGDVAIGIGIAAGAYGLYAIAVNASAIATGVVTLATWAWNAALAANPLGFVITAIGLLIAGVIQAYRHFAMFRAILWGTWEIIKEFGSLVVQAFKGVNDVIVGVLTFDKQKIKNGFAEQADVVFNSGKKLGEAFKRGYDGGMKDFAKDQAAEAAEKKGLIPTKAVTKTNTVTPTTAPKNTAAKVGGQRNISIRIDIKELIHEFKIQTTNLKEGAGKASEMVAQALLSAVNDSQIVAGS